MLAGGGPVRLSGTDPSSPSVCCSYLLNAGGGDGSPEGLNGAGDPPGRDHRWVGLQVGEAMAHGVTVGTWLPTVTPGLPLEKSKWRECPDDLRGGVSSLRSRKLWNFLWSRVSYCPGAWLAPGPGLGLRMAWASA